MNCRKIFTSRSAGSSFSYRKLYLILNLHDPKYALTYQSKQNDGKDHVTVHFALRKYKINLENCKTKSYAYRCPIYLFYISNQVFVFLALLCIKIQKQFGKHPQTIWYWSVPNSVIKLAQFQTQIGKQNIKWTNKPKSAWQINSQAVEYIQLHALLPQNIEMRILCVKIKSS